MINTIKGLCCLLGFWLFTLPVLADANRHHIKALYIPLADHYAALVAYERYGAQMKYARLDLEQMTNWDFLRARFMSGEADMAFAMGPLALSMFQKKPSFRWIGLMHRDGNAMALNQHIHRALALPLERAQRKPDPQIAQLLWQHYQDTGEAVEIAVPHLLSTHSVVLFQYFKTHGVRIGFRPHIQAPVSAIAVAPPRSPTFLRAADNRARMAAFEQSLPWADIVETEGWGKIAWYSKDVLPWPQGHVECIVLATDQALDKKFEAVREVMHYISQAGHDIEQARAEGGEALAAVITIVQRHIPSHSAESIAASLDPQLRAINFQHLGIDKPGLRQIMNLAVEGGLLREAVDLDSFADARFEQGLGP